MYVIVPAVEGMLCDRTMRSLRADGIEPRVRWIEPGDMRAYRRLLAELFADGEPFTIVEHDVETRPGFVDALERCQWAICFHAYTMVYPFDECGIPYAPLGHTRFQGPALRLGAEITSTREWLETDGYGDLDGLLGYALMQRGFYPHRHQGQVIHHHDYRSRVADY